MTAFAKLDDDERSAVVARGPGVPGHHVGVNIDRVDRVADGDAVVPEVRRHLPQPRSVHRQAGDDEIHRAAMVVPQDGHDVVLDSHRNLLFRTRRVLRELLPVLTTLVENWPGHRDGIMGPDLMGEMRAQAERFGAEIVRGHVTAVDLQSRPF